MVGVLAAGVSTAVHPSVAAADVTTASVDSLRTGWDAAEPSLSPVDVAAADFGRLFLTQLDGQVYAQPLVAAGTLIAATENDKVYGLNPATGAVRWTRDVGPAWPAAAIGCGDLTPNIGITATPVYDPATGAVYFTAKVNDGPDSKHPHWYLHAVDPATGAERTGFPVAIAGAPSNDPTAPFNPYTAMQRPGLLLLDGVVYAGFGAHCDVGPYRGYVVGVSTTTAQLTAMWATESGASNHGAGIWHSGGGLVSDGPGRIFFATGNGISPAPGPGSPAPATLAESVVRLTVRPDGSLAASDFFSPSDAPTMDLNDTDLGSGGPMALPAGFGTAGHPKLMVQAGKDGRVFLLDRDALGGSSQGPGGADAAVGSTGPFQGQWGHPALWGGDGGYVYLIGNGGPLRALRYGVTGGGLPALSAVGAGADNFGYTSGSPLVTSAGSTSGSAVVWVQTATGPTGTGGLLRAYDPVPTAAGRLTQLWSAPIGTMSKFATPATDSGRVFVGTRDGTLLGFGRPSRAPLTAGSADLGSVPVGSTGAGSVTLTASQDLTVTGVTATAPFTAAPGTLPRTMATGDRYTVPLTVTPTAAGAVSGSLTVSTTAGTVGVGLHAVATQPGFAASPAALAFDSQPTGTTNTRNVQITNTGTAAETIQGMTVPAAPFGITGVPAAGTSVPAGGSFVVSVTYAPTAAGTDTATFGIRSTSGALTVSLSGTSVTGQGSLVLTPASTDFGTVPVGAARTLSFDLTNTGNRPVTVTKAKAPAGAFSTASPLAEGLVLGEGATVHQSVTFTPVDGTAQSAAYEVTGDTGQGPLLEQLTGTGGPAGSLPSPAADSWTYNGAATAAGSTVLLTPATQQSAGSVVYDRAVPSDGLHATFTARLGPGTGGDGLTLALLDADRTTPAALGATGGGLGFSGLPGMAVTLGTSWNSQSKSTNFAGIAAGPGSGQDNLTYLTTAPVPAPLRSGAHQVDVAYSGGQLVVTVDGTRLLSRAVALPPRVLVGFTAANGSLADEHAVSDVLVRTVAALPTLDDPSWVPNGRAVRSGAAVTLTADGQKFAAGDLVSARSVAPVGLHAAFTATLGGQGTTGADGLTFALLDAASSTTASLGRDGGAAGVGGLPATFVGLHTYSANGVNAGNYVTVGTARAGTAALTILGSSTTVPNLRTGSHTVDVVVTAGSHVVVRVDGTQVLDVAVPALPPAVRVAFTAGAGSLTDTHSVSATTVSYPG